ncbi:MAG: helix-turn-helix domain-containing protein [Gammaproteobacteria bacterium]
MSRDLHSSNGATSVAASQAPLSEPLLDAAVAARLRGVRPSWIYEAVRDGRLPHVKIGRRIRFLRRRPRGVGAAAARRRESDSAGAMRRRVPGSAVVRAASWEDSMHVDLAASRSHVEDYSPVPDA